MQHLDLLQKTILEFMWCSIIYLLYRFYNNLFHPLLIFNLIWGFVTSVSVLLGNGYYFSFEALCFIFILASLFSVGWLSMSKNKGGTSLPKPSLPFYEPLILLAGLIAGIYSIYSIIVPFIPMQLQQNSFSKLALISSTLSRERYEGFRLSNFTLLSISVNYLACLSSGRYLFLVSGMFAKLIRFIPLLTLVIFSTISTSRSVFLFGFICFIAMLILAFNEKNSFKPQKIRIRYIVYAGIFACFMLTLFIISQALRQGVNPFNNSGINAILEHLKVWFAGNLSSYSIWYEKLYYQSELSNGCYTFGGIMELLGIVKRKVGVFPLSYDVSGNMDFSNIYTLVRFLIEDFGLYGSSVGIFLIGLISGFLYEKAIIGNQTAFLILGGILVELYYSFILSIISYNSVLFALFSFFLIHIIFKKRQFNFIKK